MAENGTQKSFETPGIFWLPTKPDKTVHGHLKYTAGDGAQVILLGGFHRSVFDDFPIIHGIIDNARCTLFNCNVRSSRGRQGGLQETILAVSLLLVGQQVASLDDNVFNKLKIRFSNLDDWVNFSGVQIDRAEWQRVGGPSKFDLETQPPVTAPLKESQATVALIGSHSGRFDHRHIDWEYQNFFDIAWEQPKSLHGILEFAFELQHLMALLTWRRSYISYLSVSQPLTEKAKAALGKKTFGVYGRWPINPDQQSPSELLTHFGNVTQDLPQLISGWFQSPPAVKKARHLFTSIMQSEGQFLEFKFLAFMQAVEALHRSVNSRTYTQKEDYAAIHNILVAAIPGSVSADHRASLKSRIKYGNELSLRTRLKELFLMLPDKLRNVISNDWKSFVGKSVDARNALTHPDTDGENKRDPNETYETVQRIQLLLTIILLNHIGLSFEKIEQIAHDQDWDSLITD
jgi:hypothetical protein